MGFKLQKFGPIDREYPVYEIINENKDVLLDVSRADDGTYQLTLPPSSEDHTLPLDEMPELIVRARALLEDEEREL